MVAVFKREASARTGKDSASFRDRFMAWWDGYDLLDEPLQDKASGSNPDQKPTHEVRYENALQHWEISRLGLAQKIWGEGFTTPGGTDYILKLIKAFALDPAMTVIDLGAGLGGAARIMSKEFNVWVTALETDEDLVEAGSALSVKAGMGEKVRLQHFDPESFEQKAKSLDCVFSREFLFLVEDKKALLQKLEHALKPKGQFIFTDYILAESNVRSSDLDTWAANEPKPPHLWSLAQYREALAELHLDIRIAEDITQSFRAMIIQGWSDYIAATRQGSVKDETVPALVDEVEIWTRRVQAIDSGDLGLCRLHVIKKDTDKMMSDW